MGGSQAHVGERREPGVELNRLLERIQVLLPLIRGWNPDVLVAVNSDGLVLAGILNQYLEREVRFLLVTDKDNVPAVVKDTCGRLGKKRVLLVAGRFSSEPVRDLVEERIRLKQPLSMVRMVGVGKGVEYSCFPEFPPHTLLPWEYNEVG